MLYLIVLFFVMESSAPATDLSWVVDLQKKSLERAEKYRLDAEVLVQNSENRVKKCLIQRPSNQTVPGSHPSTRSAAKIDSAFPLFSENNDFEGNKNNGVLTSHAPKKQAPSDLRVFVSFSMPDAVLQALARDVAATGGKLVFRGLIKDSFRITAEKLKTLQIEALIDPVAFRDNSITGAPTFIQGLNRLKGNVSVAYVLAQFAGENL